MKKNCIETLPSLSLSKMPAFKFSRYRYQPLRDVEHNERKGQDHPRTPWDRAGFVPTSIIWLCCTISLVLLSIAAVQSRLFAKSIKYCQRPSIRREWRTLSNAQRSEYIDAVKCLQSSPSLLNRSQNVSRFDDFPWLHQHVGYFGMLHV